MQCVKIYVMGSKNRSLGQISEKSKNRHPMVKFTRISLRFCLNTCIIKICTMVKIKKRVMRKSRSVGQTTIQTLEYAIHLIFRPN